MFLKMRECSWLGRVVVPACLFALCCAAMPASAVDRSTGRISAGALEAALPSLSEEPVAESRHVDEAPVPPTEAEIESFFVEHHELFS